MANTSGYSFAKNTPVVKEFYIDNKDGLTKVKEVQGLQPFGANSGILTEDKLTPSIVEFLLSKDEFKDYLVKDKKDAKGDKADKAE
jgi:hypothetical protein